MSNLIASIFGSITGSGAAKADGPEESDKVVDNTTGKITTSAEATAPNNNFMDDPIVMDDRNISAEKWKRFKRWQ
jgi:hypothetical protein